MDLYKSLSITDEIRLCNLHLALKRKQNKRLLYLADDYAWI